MIRIIDLVLTHKDIRRWYVRFHPTQIQRLIELGNLGNSTFHSFPVKPTQY